MKLIEAIIKPGKLDEVTSALTNLGVDDYMESAIFCHGRQQGQAMLYRGAEYVSSFVEKIKLEVVAADESVGKITDAIAAIAKTERQEDCRIYVLPFVDAT